MNYLMWRLHRNQLFFAAGAIAALSVLLLVTGIKMANDYHAFLSSCAATQSCSDGGQLFSGDGAILDLVNLTIVVPLLFGLFWGAPLISKEFEDGTHNLVWTQGVTRQQLAEGQRVLGLSCRRSVGWSGRPRRQLVAVPRKHAVRAVQCIRRPRDRAGRLLTFSRSVSGSQ